MALNQIDNITIQSSICQDPLLPKAAEYSVIIYSMIPIPGSINIHSVGSQPDAYLARSSHRRLNV